MTIDGFPRIGIVSMYFTYCITRVVSDSEPASDHVVRLLAFVPGQMLHSVPYTPTLMFETGETAARIGNCLKVRASGGKA